MVSRTGVIYFSRFLPSLLWDTSVTCQRTSPIRKDLPTWPSFLLSDRSHNAAVCLSMAIVTLTRDLLPKWWIPLRVPNELQPGTLHYYNYLCAREGSFLILVGECCHNRVLTLRSQIYNQRISEHIAGIKSDVLCGVVSVMCGVCVFVCGVWVYDTWMFVWVLDVWSMQMQ